MIRVTIDSLDGFVVLNNMVLVESVSDSLSDHTSDVASKITIIRNDSNKKREISIGRVVGIPNTLFWKYKNKDISYSVDDLNVGDTVIYDTHSRIYKIETREGEYSDKELYLVRFPDIIAKCEE